LNLIKLCTKDKIITDVLDIIQNSKVGNCHYNINKPTIPFVNLHLSLLMKENGLENWMRHKYKNSYGSNVQYDGKSWISLYKDVSKHINFIVALERNLYIFAPVLKLSILLQ
jgi:hypothetical protein